MDKSEAIRILNRKLSSSRISARNAHWSNLVKYSAEIGWWLNVPFHKFENDLYLILNDDPRKCFYCIKLPGKTLNNPENKFRNKQETADIFMASSGRMRMIDTQSGSSNFDFNPHQIDVINY